MRNVPYSTHSTVPSASASELIDHALQMNKFESQKTLSATSSFCHASKRVLMTYYRNNIAHVGAAFADGGNCHPASPHLPLRIDGTRDVLYPMLKAELFLRWDRDELPDVIDALANEMQRQGLITLQDDELHINPVHSRTLQLLAAGARKRCNVMPSPSGC
ncbi:hypothetical protein ACLB1M_31855 [Escherichia coli]